MKIFKGSWQLVLLTAFLLLGIANPGKAVFLFPPEVMECYHKIIRGKISEGQADLKLYIKNNPDDASAIFVENYADFVYLIASDDKEAFRKLEPNFEKRLKRLSKENKNSPWYYYCEAELRLQWCLIYARYGERLSSIWQFKQAASLSATCKEKYTHFVPVFKTLGVCQTLLTITPENYRWILKGFPVTPDPKSAEALLTYAAETDNLFQEEATLYLRLMGAFLLHKGSAYHLELLYRAAMEKEDHLLWQYYSAQAGFHFKNPSIILKAATNISKMKLRQDYPIVWFYAGHAELSKLNAPKAEEYLNYYNRNRKGDYFAKAAKLNLCFAQVLNNKVTEAKESLQSISQMKEGSVTERDRQAVKAAASGKLLPTEVLKIRLPEDGGIPTLAIAESKKINTDAIAIPHRIEYFYRLAKCYETLNLQQDAENNYKKAILICPPKPQTHYGPSAVYRLALLYQAQGKKTEAKETLADFKNFSEYEYENDLKQKTDKLAAELN